MTSTPYDEILQKSSDTEINTNKKKKRKKKKNNQKKTNYFSYLYLFSFVFLGALWGLSHAIKIFSPEIDVAIGDSDTYTLSDSDVDMEIKKVDERLKWIQMEDELPTVSIRGFDKNNKSDKAEKEEKYQKENKNNADIITKSRKKENEILEKRKQKREESIPRPPMPTISEIKLQHDDFKNIPATDVISQKSEIEIKEKDISISHKNVVPKPKHSITKVYLGNYSTMEEAQEVSNKVKSIDSGISPYVKSVNGKYVVQLGSFSDGDKAGKLSENLRNKGYYPKIKYEN